MDARDFREGDLRALQRLVQDAWSVVGEQNRFHVGDLAWGTYSIAGEEGGWRRRLWEEDGRVVA